MWIKLSKAWNGHEVGAELNLDEVEAQKLIKDGIAEATETPKPVASATSAIAQSIVRSIGEALPAMVDQ